MNHTGWRKAGVLVVGAWLLVGAALFVLDIPRFAEFLGNARVEGPRTYCINNIRQLGLALHSYHDQYGSFPPAHTVNAEGRRLHSWRTLLLPYMDRNDFYESLRLDEPWDSAHNSQVFAQRPFAGVGFDIMRCPSDVRENAIPPLATSYLAVVGPDTAFPGSECVSLDDITDDPTQTLLIVEVANSGILWMEPRDLHVTQMATTVNATSGQGICSEHPGGAVVVFADGHTEFLSESTTAEELAAMLTIAGDEEVDRAAD